MTFDMDSFVSTGKHAAAVIPMLVGLGYALLRAGSTFPLLARAWRWVGGTSTVSNERVAAYLRDQHDLSSFQFHSGLRPHSLRKTTQLIDWSDADDIPIERTRRCGTYFDLRSSENAILYMVDHQENEFSRLELPFSGLFGRPLHAIDCQGPFLRARQVLPRGSPRPGK